MIHSTKPLKESTLEIYRSRSLLRGQRWYWRLTHDNGEVIAASSEGYGTTAEATNNASKVISGYYWRET